MDQAFDLTLDGIRPEPLGSYLKALAVLRLVSEQKDARAAGYWRDDVFHLRSSLDRDALLRFFTHEYAPTPIVGPWGARSGFFPGSSERSARAALNAIVESRDPRLTVFREAIVAVRALLERKGLSEKAKDEDKVELLADLRNELPDAALPWLDAAYVLGARDERGQLSRAFPPILGTGGNEGSQGYSSTFMQALIEAGVIEGNARAPVNALFGLPEEKLSSMSSGQYLPGLTGGFNRGHGFSGGSSPMSPWEIVLLFEGAATWVSGPSVRQGTRAIGRESSPFTVRQRSIDGSAAAAEEEKARAELWAPLWKRPTRWVEIAALLAEGRMHVGRRPARDTLEMARAATSLGVDRGIASFVRYPILVRNGKSYFAFAIGRFAATERPETDLVASLDRPLGRLDALIRREKNTPARIESARRRVSEAVFELLRAGGPVRAREVLRAVGRLDQEVSRWSAGREIAPLGGLSPRWLKDAQSSPELRIAAAIASIRGRTEVGPLRSNLVGVDPAKPSQWDSGTGQSAWRGPTLTHRMASALTRRMMDGARDSGAGNPFWGPVQLNLTDIAEFIDGRVSDSLIEELIHALSWIDWDDPGARDLADVLGWWKRPRVHVAVPRTYALLKLCFWPTKLDKGDERHVVPEPALVRLVLGGRIAEACQLAQRRLRTHGLSVIDLATSLAPLIAPSVAPARLAASLLIPVASGELHETLIPAVSLTAPTEERAR